MSWTLLFHGLFQQKCLLSGSNAWLVPVTFAGGSMTIKENLSPVPLRTGQSCTDIISTTSESQYA